MVKKIFKMTIWILLRLTIIALILFGVPRLVTQITANGKIFTATDAPRKRVAVVFGAGLTRDGAPTAILQDRVAAAAELYKTGKVEKLLMSGDNRFVDYNEPGAMLAYAVGLGVPEEDVVLDYAGRRTYDTCYRAKEIFGLTDVLLVTQRFHLPRAIFTCTGLGLKSAGVLSDLREYRISSRLYWYMRELPATLMSLVDVWIRHPLPVLGDREPIFPDGQ